eukprot:TRINITY_DN1337_c0_g1_i1.p1 TRINITY_DN1337_c0_g1~~TRINITY_DN1337_c0_g1_i1.p1  ORF type:complete len:132 (+),score=39.15 TRINITY_DN1337_c0_g1_i1:54-449(+)
MASRDNEPANITVTWEDQKKICRFHRLHKRECEVDDDLALLKQRVEHITDAETEIFVADDIKFTMGESFINMDFDEVQEQLEKVKAATEEQIQTLEDEKQEIRKIMTELKAQLYAAFGNAIYLETDNIKEE